MAVRLLGWVGTVPLALATMTVVAPPAHAAPEVDWQDQPSISSTDVRVGEEVVGSIGSWSGEGPLSYELRWELCQTSYETPDCVLRTSLSTTDPDVTLAYTPTAADNTAPSGIGADHRVLRFSVAATDDSGTTVELVQRRVRAGRLWETPRHSFFERGEPTGMTVRQRWADAVAMAPDGTSTVIGSDLINFDQDTETAEYLYGAQQIGPDGARSAVEQIDVGQRVAETVGTAADGTGRVYVAYQLGDDGPLQVTERDPSTGSWSAPQVLAAADRVQRHGTLSADGAGHAALWWVAPAAEDEPQELRIATRAQGGGWSVHAVDQPASDPCEGSAFLDVIDEAVVDIGPDGDVAAVWARQHTSCYDTHPSHIADSVVSATYLVDGTWTGVDQVVRLPGINGYRPEQLDVSQAGAALTFSYTEFFDGTSNEGKRVNLYLLTAGANGSFPDLDPTDPAGGGAATTLYRDEDSAGGVSSPSSLGLNDHGQFTVAWDAAPWGGDYSIQAAYGTIAGGAGAAETVVANYRTGVDSPEVAIADNGKAAIVTDGRRGLFAIRDAGASSWDEAQSVELADPQWAMMKQYTAWPGDSVSFDSSHQLWAAGSLGRDSSHFADIQWNHVGVTRLASPAGGLRGDIAHVDGPVGRPLTLSVENVVSPGDQAVSFAWDVDDDGQFDDGTAPEAEASFDSPGRKTVAVRLSTPDGDRAFAEREITVRENAPPYLHSIHWQPMSPVAGVPVTFTAIAHDDFDDEQLTYEWWVDDVEQPSETGKELTVALPASQHEVSVRATDLSGAASQINEATVTVQPAPVDPRTLDVESLGAGEGTITSNPGGISCTPDCTEEYDGGTTVTLTATPAIGSRLDGWEGCDEEVSAGTQCVVEMTADRDVSATFVPEDAPVPTRTLTIVKDGDGSGRVTGTGIDCGTDCKEGYDEGTELTLTAVPGAGSAVTGWSGCDSIDGNSCRVTMGVDRQVTAHFGRQTVAVDTQITRQKVLVKKRKVRFTFEGSGGTGASSFQCRLDDGRFRACDSPKAYRKVTKGKHVFKVRAMDSTGAVDTTPAKAKFRMPRR